MTLRRAAEKVFGKRVDEEAFSNSRRRPDLLILKDATVSLVGSEKLNEATQLYTLQDVLLIELKRGQSRIGRNEIRQADEYIEELLHAGILDGSPFIRAFVVGDSIDDRIEPVRRIGERPAARIDACTFSQLVRTAHGRLFRLRDELTNRYAEMQEPELLRRAMESASQLDLDEPIGA
jgi:hypothetical protein